MKEILPATNEVPFWSERLSSLYTHSSPQVGFHLAIFVEPYLQYVLDGKKTIESRFSIRPCPPYESVGHGDVLLLKRASGPVVGICEVLNAWYYELDPACWQMIRDRFGEAICPQKGFWEERQRATVATLLRVGHVNRIDPIECKKKDRRGWVVLSDATPHRQQLPLELG